MQRTLGLFAKEPVAGCVKTRLAAETSPAYACRVHEAFLLDTLDRLQQLAVQRVICFAPDGGRAYFDRVAAGRFELRPQSSGTLGERLQSFFRWAFEQGAHAVLALGADSPTLPVTLLAQAFAELARADVVLGPATDGGYYLIGSKQFQPGLFENIDWSTPRVLEQTCAQVHALRQRLALLPPWYDVDTLADWQFLRGHVAALLAAGIDPQVPRTLALLAEGAATK